MIVRQGKAAPLQVERRSPLPGGRQRGVPPAQGVPGDLRTDRGHHLQDERLGVPEGVPLVAGAGQRLAGDGPTLGARRGLQQLEQREPDGLLQLVVAVDLDVRALPEAVEDGALAREQPVEALVPGDRQRSRQLVAQRGQLAGVRPRVRHELGQRDRLAGLQLRADREPGVVGGGLAVHVELGGALDVVVGRGADQQPGAQGAVHESEPAVRVVFLRLEGMLEQVVGRGMARQVRLPGVGDEPGLQHDLDGPFQRAHRVAQGEHAALVERHEPGGARPRRCGRPASASAARATACPPGSRARVRGAGACRCGRRAGGRRPAAGPPCRRWC